MFIASALTHFCCEFKPAGTVAQSSVVHILEKNILNANWSWRYKACLYKSLVKCSKKTIEDNATKNSRLKKHFLHIAQRKRFVLHQTASVC